jgi:hypothetical protein
MKMFLTSLTLLLTATAFGKSTTEYYFQPAAGGSALELTYESAAATVKYDPSGESKVTAGDFHINYAYGLDANSALGIYTFSGTVETKTTTTSKADGMGDLHLYYKGFSDFLHYGADLGINTAKNKTDNRSTGGPSINLNVGGLWTASGWNFGGDLTYRFLMERTDDSSPAQKTTEGNVVRVAGFGEYNYGSGFIGGELSDSMVADSKTKVSGTTTTNKGENYIALKAYGSLEFSDMVEGLLSIEDQMHPKISANSTKAYSETILALGVRLNF